MEKIIYSEITALSNRWGYCSASNSYFAKLYEVSNETVSRWISNLQKQGYITCETVYDNNRIVERRIYIDNKINRSMTIKSSGTCENNHQPIDENIKDNITRGTLQDIIDINKMSLEEYKRLKQSDYSYVNFAITSGSLINVNICQQLGGFDNMLFIDCVDLDYSKKVEIEGYKQIRINSTYLLQQVGNAEKTKIMRVHKDNAGKISIMPYYRTNHSLFRQYYMARNHIIIINK